MLPISASIRASLRASTDDLLLPDPASELGTLSDRHDPLRSGDVSPLPLSLVLLNELRGVIAIEPSWDTVMEGRGEWRGHSAVVGEWIAGLHGGTELPGVPL